MSDHSSHHRVPMYGKLIFKKRLLKEASCPTGGSIYRVNGTENMNIFRQDSQTVLFTPKGHFSLERPAKRQA